MRGADLLGLPVRSPSDRDLGTVLDVRLVQDGPLLGAFAAMRVQGFVVGRRRTASRLGYDRHEAHGPWLIRVLVRRLTRSNRFLAWEDCELAEGQVRSLVEELAPLPTL